VVSPMQEPVSAMSVTGVKIINYGTGTVAHAAGIVVGILTMGTIHASAHEKS
jgi:hypothetical protein